MNRGIISPLALSRTDLKVQALSAQVQTNWMPRELGSMMLRPGTAWLDSTYNNGTAVHVPFMKSISDTAIIELTNQLMRVRVSEAIISRVSVGTTITNGTFTSSLTGWTNADEGGATSAWASAPFVGYSGTYMSLKGNGNGSRAIESQSVTVASGDHGKEHALRLVVSKGYVTIRVGTTLGDDSYVNAVTLAPGTYSLAFTPTGNFVIEFTANTSYASLINSVAIEAAGAMTIPAPWLAADLTNVRFDQSEDELFIACAGYAQYKIERIGTTRSWAVVNYLSDDGPFQIINTDLSTQMSVSGLTGDVNLVSSNPYFKTGHVGALFQITSSSQNTSDVIGGANQFTEYIEVTDVGANRTFNFQITGTWSGTIYLERSVGTPGTWVSVASYTSNQNTTYLDGLDNQIIYYRFNFEAGYVSGSASVAMQYPNGGITGICRVTGFSSNTSVQAEVLKSFGSSSASNAYAGGYITFSVNPTASDTITLNGVAWTFVASGASGAQTNIQGTMVATLAQLANDLTASANSSLTVATYSATSTKLLINYKTTGTGGNAYTLAASAATPSGTHLTGGSTGTGSSATSLWSEGQWSPLNGYPTSCNFLQGRLWWYGNDSVNGSVSDAYASFDATIIGDSAPISSNIGSGPVQNICWGAGFSSLVLGGEYKEFSIRSSVIGLLTATDFVITSPSSRGSAKVAACQIDSSIVFVQRGDVDTGNNQYGTRLIQMNYQGIYAPVDYSTVDLSILTPEILAVGISRIAVQRKIDTRIHCLLQNGQVAICLFDPVENLKAFVMYETTGTVIDLFVMPGGVEDKVYYVVQRTINGSTVTYFERWALESECVGGSINKNIDAHVVITNGSPSTSVAAPSLAGETCVVWADGADVGTLTLDGSGNGTLAVAATNVVIGIGYTAQFQTAKLAFAAQAGTAINMIKSIDNIGVVLANTHSQGLLYGPDFSDLDNMPLTEGGTTYATGTVWSAYDNDTFAFGGRWDTDSRLCLQAASPRPCNVLSVVIGMTTEDRI
jgi:hypothetical protein